MHFLFTALMLFTTLAQASTVQLSLMEEGSSEKVLYAFDTKEFKLSEISSIDGQMLASTTKYTTQHRKLVGSGRPLAAADDILFECEVDGMDLVIVREEYNAFFGPMKLLLAFAGHPVQVSKIVVYAIANDAIVGTREVTIKEDAYRWIAGVYK